MTTVWGKRISHLLHQFRVSSPYFRGKARLFHWFRVLTKCPRLTIRYGNNGWITVNDEGEGIEKHVWYYGVHEAEVWNALATYASAEDVFWDIGANIGTVAIQAILDKRVCEVHCFEPIPRIATILDDNLRLNGSNYAIHQFVLGNEVGKSYLHLGPLNQSDVASLTINRNKGDIQVDCTTVDKLITSGLTPPTLVKIDVEGWEENVLLGATALLRNHPPTAIAFEANCSVDAKLSNQRLYDIFNTYGYTISHIKRNVGHMFTTESGEYIENFLAVRA